MECALQNLRAQCVEPLIEGGGALRIPRRKRVANTCNNACILECGAAAPLSIHAVQLCERD